MNKIPEAIEHSKLLKKLVLDRETVENQGTIEELWLNPKSHQVIGFTCGLGIFSKQKKYFAWEQIDTIGTDAILVNGNLEQEHLEKPNNIIHIIGNEVWTDAGNKVGFLVEYLLDSQTGKIVNYLFKSNGWWGMWDSVYLLPPEAVSSAGNKRVIVTKTSVENPDSYTQGFDQKLDQVQDFLQADLGRTREHIEVVRCEAKKLAVGFQQRAKVVKEQAQERAQVVAEQAKQRVEEFQGKSVERPEPIQPNSDEFHSKIQQVAAKAKEKIGGVQSQWGNNSTATKDDDETNGDKLEIQP